jgi:hypothetical protein
MAQGKRCVHRRSLTCLRSHDCRTHSLACARTTAALTHLLALARLLALHTTTTNRHRHRSRLTSPVCLALRSPHIQTIIEALKYITTQSLPPGVSKADWLHDPKVAQQATVVALIKLRFRDQAGKIRASLELTHTHTHTHTHTRTHTCPATCMSLRIPLCHAPELCDAVFTSDIVC